MASKSGVMAGKAFVLLEAIDGTAATLRNVENRFLSWGSRLQATGMRIFARGLTGMVPAALSTNIFKQFDDIMRRVEARTQGTSGEMQGLRQQAIGLGRDSAFSAREVAGLQDVLAQRKFNRTDIATMTPSIAMLGRAGGGGDNPGQDLLNAADLVSQAIMMYELAAKDAAHVSDIFTVAANESNFALEDLIISMANAGPVAHQYGFALEDTLAAMMVMRDLSIDPSIAGTGLRNLFIKASDKKATEDFNKLMMEMTHSSVQFEDAVTGNLNSVVDILFSFSNATKSLGTAQRGHLLAELFGLRAITPATAVAASPENFTKALTALKNVTGATEAAYKKMEDGIGGVFRRLGNTLEAAALQYADTLEEPIIAFGKAIVKVNLDIADWIANNQSLVIQLTMLAAVLLPLGASLIVLGTTLKLIAFMLMPFSMALGLVYTILNATIISLIWMVGTLWTLTAAILATTVAIITGMIPVLITLGGLFVQIAGQIILAVLTITGAVFTLVTAIISALVPALIYAIFYVTALGTVAIVETTKAMFGLAIAVANVAFAIMTGVLGMSVATSMMIANLIAQGILLLSQFGVAIAISLAVAGIIVGAYMLIQQAFSSTNAELDEMNSKVQESESIWSQFVAGAVGYWQGFTNAISQSIDFIIARFWEMFETVGQTMNGISDAMQAGDLDLAWNIALTGMRLLWAQFKDFVAVSWYETITYVKTLINSLIDDMVRMKNSVKDWLFLLAPGATMLGEYLIDSEKLKAKITGPDAVKQWERKSDIDFYKQQLDLLTNLANRRKLWAEAVRKGQMNNIPQLDLNIKAPGIQDLIQNGARGDIGGAKAVEASTQYTMEGAKQAYENNQNRLENIQNQELKELQGINGELKDANENLENILNKPAEQGV
jgi:TP901 family phage tail tape measure protein